MGNSICADPEVEVIDSASIVPIRPPQPENKMKSSKVRSKRDDEKLVDQLKIKATIKSLETRLGRPVY